MIEFKLTTEYIPLFVLLKLTGLSETGGQAKLAISQGRVIVNGKVETRKACKIRAGQSVSFAGETILIEK